MEDLRVSLVQADTVWHDPRANRELYARMMAPLVLLTRLNRKTIASRLSASSRGVRATRKNLCVKPPDPACANRKSPEFTDAKRPQGGSRRPT